MLLNKIQAWWIYILSNIKALDENFVLNNEIKMTIYNTNINDQFDTDYHYGGQ